MLGLSSLGFTGLRSSKTPSYKGVEKRRCSERRVHSDRRREPRVGDIKERRSGVDRRGA